MHTKRNYLLGCNDICQAVGININNSGYYTYIKTDNVVTIYNVALHFIILLQYHLFKLSNYFYVYVKYKNFIAARTIGNVASAVT